MKKRVRNNSPNAQNKKRILFFLSAFFVVTLALVVRLGYIQLIKGNDYKKMAYEQWAKDVVITAKRGTIYDTKGKKLAVSVNASTVVCFPADVRKGSSDASTVDTEEESEEDSGNFFTNFLTSFSKKLNEDKSEEITQVKNENLKSLDEIATILAEILELDKDKVYDKITDRSKYLVLKRWITEEQVEKIREAKLTGISIIDDNKRVYPYGNFAPYVLGFTNVDQQGLYGVEATFDDYLTGVPGRLVVNTDGVGRELPYGYNEYYEPQDGYGIVLTIDETIQHFAEKAAQAALENANAKRITVTVMDPTTGDVLAMAVKPDYDPNEPREATDPITKAEWDNLDNAELQKKWFDMWRNPIVNDIYEPGSTFKPLTIAIALAENKISYNDTFYCDGYVRDVKSSKPIKCWRYYNPHGQQTLPQVLQNSCNDALATIGLKIGPETFYNYIRALGFGEVSGIPLNGEAKGIVTHWKYMQDVNIATQSFGQSISMTPLQLTTAISCLANGGELMQPRIVKQLIDDEGNVVRNFDTVVRRKVFPKEISDAMLEMLESVVSVGGGKNAAVPGYSVGGKTGTAQKVEDGVYAEGKYVSSFVGVAPTYDPKVVCLLTVDEPQGTYFASLVAAPYVGQIIGDTLKYMDVEPKYTEEELGYLAKATVEVPDLVGLTITEASKLLDRYNLKHNVTIDIEPDTIIKDQFPQPGTTVTKDSMVTLVLN